MTPDTAKALIEAADNLLELEKTRSEMTAAEEIAHDFGLSDESEAYEDLANPSTIKQLAEAYLGMVEALKEADKQAESGLCCFKLPGARDALNSVRKAVASVGIQGGLTAHDELGQSS